MKLTFLGATQTVTGSKFLLETRERRILIDCGLFQGAKDLRLRNWEPPPVDPKSVDAMILTHAHIDHTGYLPRFVSQGYKGPIYATPATVDLARILLPDSAHLQEEEARYRNKHHLSKHQPALPLYTIDDAMAALALLRPVKYGETVSLSTELGFDLTPAGHILGSAFVRFRDGSGSSEKTVLIPVLPVYVDSPMAVDAVDIFRKHVEEHDLEMTQLERAGGNPLYTQRVHFARSVEDSKAINDHRFPSIIISANGMATGGRILHHLLQRLPDERNSIVFVGFQALGTRGRLLSEGARQIRIFGVDYPVRAAVHVIDSFSAHGDYSEILRWLGGFLRAPRKTFLVHGEPKAIEAMKDHIVSAHKAWQVEIPAYLQPFEI